MKDSTEVKRMFSDLVVGLKRDIVKDDEAANRVKEVVHTLVDVLNQVWDLDVGISCRLYSGRVCYEVRLCALESGKVSFRGETFLGFMRGISCSVVCGWKGDCM